MTETASIADLGFAREMLPLVSRTFAPAIDILPPALAESVRLSYLLCRVADTIEDATGIAPERRAAWLERFRALLAEDAAGGEAAGSLLARGIAGSVAGATAEARLVEGLPRLLRLLQSTSPAERAAIVHWTGELALGMARFVRREEGEAGRITALATCEELDAYEYYVAGTVGCLLHELIRVHVPAREPTGDEAIRRLAVSFGLGLQGTNIIQDLSDDRARGWSYLPEEVARRHGTATARLHLPEEEERAMAAVREMAGRAARHLDDGLEFVLALPRRAARVRLFCAWPLFLAVRTLSRVVAGPAVLHQRVRITREEVRALTSEAMRRVPTNAGLRRLYERERALLDASMQAAAVKGEA